MHYYSCDCTLASKECIRPRSMAITSQITMYQTETTACGDKALSHRTQDPWSFFKMVHSAVWCSRPHNYGKGSREWYPPSIRCSP